MLQQTQVRTVQAYFIDFISKWPTIKALGDAPVDDLMKAWAGLGYYPGHATCTNVPGP